MILWLYTALRSQLLLIKKRSLSTCPCLIQGICQSHPLAFGNFFLPAASAAASSDMISACRLSFTFSPFPYFLLLVLPLPLLGLFLLAFGLFLPFVCSISYDKKKERLKKETKARWQKAKKKAAKNQSWRRKCQFILMSLHGFPVATATATALLQRQLQLWRQLRRRLRLRLLRGLHWYRWRNWELLCLNVCRQRLFVGFLYRSLLSRHVSDMCQRAATAATSATSATVATTATTAATSNEQFFAESWWCLPAAVAAPSN